jgi:hypothetical protein
VPWLSWVAIRRRYRRWCSSVARARHGQPHVPPPRSAARREFDWVVPPAQAECAEAPESCIEADQEGVDFGRVEVGSFSVASVTLSSCGDAAVSVTDVALDSDTFYVDSPSTLLNSAPARNSRLASSPLVTTAMPTASQSSPMQATSSSFHWMARAHSIRRRSRRSRSMVSSLWERPPI